MLCVKKMSVFAYKMTRGGFLPMVDSNAQVKFINTSRHTSSCRCVGFPYSPQSLTGVSSWGFVRLPPSYNLNYLGSIGVMGKRTGVVFSLRRSFFRFGCLFFSLY
ncbi:hypothetical protein EG333_14805 [Pectobacterium versatile]|nr:hypothetical protein EG333_14805 [Pectobacterium versatile]